ncbi:MAG: hypothetical protein ACYTGN_08470 [Planctomycetota bacterium]|jgi:hypothetical protein
MRILTLGLVLCAAVQAQSNEEKLEAKLAKPFAKNAEWITDYDAAKAKAVQSGKLIFAYFTRSYAP